ENGAGLICDEALREFLSECNDRNLSHGLGAMPMRFNVLEAFTVFHPQENWFGLLREVDHLFLLSDFFDFATGADAPLDPITVASSLPEGVIHSYNAIGDLKNLAFLHADGRSFVVGGVILVRHGSELSYLLIGGVVTDLTAASARVVQFW